MHSKMSYQHLSLSHYLSSEQAELHLELEGGRKRWEGGGERERAIKGDQEAKIVRNRERSSEIKRVRRIVFLT